MGFIYMNMSTKINLTIMRIEADIPMMVLGVTEKNKAAKDTTQFIIW